MSESMKYVLVTGTNGGLGLGICTRLIDDFLRTHPQASSLTLIFTTRSVRKGQETLNLLRSHLSKNHAAKSQSRIRLQPENVELTNLLNVRALASKLLRSDLPQLNAVILNAGIGGWAGLDWPVAVRDTLANMVTNTTWPKFKLGISGLITENQLSTEGKQEPVVGQVFCANVFGHYLLAHWLMPLLCACEPVDPGRIIWVGSIEPMERHFKEEDLQALTTAVSYESSKRLTDLLALTFDTEAVRRSYQDYTSCAGSDAAVQGAVKREIRSTPTMRVAQPGICTTAIVALYWIVHQFYILSIYMARWAGSPWATASTYLAAMSFTWLALAPMAEIQNQETQLGRGGGRVKWGTATDRLGQGRVRATEVQGWGLNGNGDAFTATWWGGGYGRAPGSKDATKDDVDAFVACGARAWREMERMRKEWEGLINDVPEK